MRGLGIATLAIAQGRLAAEDLHARLTVKPPPARAPVVAIGPERLRLDAFAPSARHEAPHASPAERLAAPEREVAETLTDDDFAAEVARCCSCGQCCGCQRCFMYCNPRDVFRLEQPVPGTYFTISHTRCEGCGKCIELCPCGVLALRPPGELPPPRTAPETHLALDGPWQKRPDQDWLRRWRRHAAELVLGLRWGECERYNTRLPARHRPAVLAALAAYMGCPVPVRLDFASIHAISIAAPAATVFAELGTFGNLECRFFRLNLIWIEHVRGRPNETGAEIRYRLDCTPLRVSLRLGQVIPNHLLVYDADEKLARDGRLVLAIFPEGERCHLVVYSVFNFKRGQGLVSRSFWGLFRGLFPRWLHDVVWTHAMCCLKDDLEKAAKKAT